MTIARGQKPPGKCEEKSAPRLLGCFVLFVLNTFQQVEKSVGALHQAVTGLVLFELLYSGFYLKQLQLQRNTSIEHITENFANLDKNWINCSTTHCFLFLSILFLQHFIYPK